MRRRVVLLPLLVLMHIAVLAVALDTSTAAPPTRPAAALVTHAVPATVERVVDPPMTELVVATEIEAPKVQIATEGALDGAGSCNVADTIRAVLVADSLTQGALAAIPQSARTVANAVMLWDGHWVSRPLRAGGTGLDKLRAIIVDGIRTVPADCRTAAVGGPRLIVIPDGATTVVLAFGSGNWSWSELLG